MWLLNTKTAVLHKFNRPEDVPGGYAILSHVWGKPEEEDTFQSVQAAAKTCEENAARARTQSALSAGLAGLSTSSELTDIVLELQKAVRQQAEMLSVLSARMEQLESGSQTRIVVSGCQDTPEAPVRPVSTTCTLLSEGTPSLYTTSSPTVPRDSNLISRKTRKFLTQAEKDGYEWAWADTCCIDKTSSMELTEAINSMFHFYSLSDICYVYLADVPDGTPADSEDFRFNKWHKRGWTLQELLAPHNVVFMSRNWKPLGNKYALAEALHDATRIPASVLRLEEDFTTMSIATRMSWAAMRKTTRIEDEAYCLLGIFGVNMPTIYGEGRNAFYRLQEEIVKSSTDSTFLVSCGIPYAAVKTGDSLYLSVGEETEDTIETLIDTFTRSPEVPSHALARSPEDFLWAEDIVMGYVATGKQVSLVAISTFLGRI